MGTSLLGKVKGYVVSCCKPDMVLVFGSYARGEANKFSDLDLVVVCNYVYNRKMLERKIKSDIRRYSLKADVMVRSQCEIMEAIKDPHSFLGSILEKAKIIYKKPAYSIDN